MESVDRYPNQKVSDRSQYDKLLKDKIVDK